MLQFMGSQRVGHDSVTDNNNYCCDLVTAKNNHEPGLLTFIHTFENKGKNGMII